MNIQRIKLVKVPQISTKWISSEVNSPYLPPLSLATITAYLREEGFIVNQDDLNQKIHYNNFHNKTKINLDLLNNPQQLISFLEGKGNKKIKKFLDYMIKSTNLKKFDTYLISLGVMRFDLKYTSASISTEKIPYLRSSSISALILCKYLKEVYKKPIVIGGDVRPELIKLNSKFKLFDYAITGPGEIAIHKLLNALNSNKSFHKIKGLIYWKNKKLIQNPGHYTFSLIKPDFKGLPLKTYTWQPPPWIQKHIKNKKQKILILPIQFITGCPNNCAYCTLSEKLKYITPTKTTKILKELKEEYKTPYFMFLSNTLNISKKYTNQLCNQIIKNKLKIYWTDSFYPHNLNKQTLTKLKKAGCIRTVFGLETASPKLLKSVNKNIKLNECKQIFKSADSIGLWTHINLISGLPTETKKDITKTLEFMNQNKEYINDFHIAPFTLFKMSKMFSFPKYYKIKNIKEDYVNSKLNKNQPVYSFDEEKGLKWKEKLKQINYSTKKIKYNSQIEIDPFLESYPLLFYLYSNIKDKKTIKKIRTSVIKRLNRTYLYKHPIISLKKVNKSKNPSWLIKRMI